MSAENGEDQSRPTLSKAPSEHYWDWLLHEDDLFSNRINFFLIAETMLLIAFAINAYDNANLTIIVGGAGILFASIWMYVSIFQIFSLINPIKRRLRETFPEYREVKAIIWIGDPNLWLGIVFPAVLLTLWVALVVEE